MSGAEGAALRQLLLGQQLPYTIVDEIEAAVEHTWSCVLHKNNLDTI